MAEFSVHPEYKLLSPDWRKWYDMAEGKHDTLIGSDYLWYHAIEQLEDPISKKIRVDRENRTRNLNLTKTITWLWQTLFMKRGYQEMKPAVIRAIGEEELKNVDGTGKSLCSFVRDDIIFHYLVSARVYCMCNSLAISAPTVADAQAIGQRPYLRVINPMAIPDWAIETGDAKRLNKLNSFREVYEIVRPRRSVLEPLKVETISAVYHRSETGSVVCDKFMAVRDEKGNLLRKDSELQWIPLANISGEVATAEIQGFDEIPVARIMSESWIQDVVEEALRHYNLRSTKDNIQYNAGYPKTFIAGDGLTSTDNQKLFTERTIALLPAGSTVTQLAPAPTGDYDRAIAEAADNCFKLGLNQHRFLPSDSKDGAAATSQQEEKDNLYTMIRTAAEEIENCVNESLRYFVKFKGGPEDFDAGFKLHEVDNDDLTEWLTLYNTTKGVLSRVDEFDKETAKFIIPRLGYSDEATKKLLKNAETSDFTPMMQQMMGIKGDIVKDSMNGRGKEVPGKPKEDGSGDRAIQSEGGKGVQKGPIEPTEKDKAGRGVSAGTSSGPAKP